MSVCFVRDSAQGDVEDDVSPSPTLLRSSKFENVSSDVQLLILSYCRVEDVVKAQQTCRALFNLISTSRSLWLNLLRKLPYDQAPNLAPHISLRSLSDTALRYLVVQAVKGYYNWRSPFGPQITRECVVSIQKRRFLADADSSILLPGGEHILVHLGSGKFNCMRVDTGEVISHYRPEFSLRRMGHSIRFFDCDYVDGGKNLILAFTGYLYEPRQRETFVEVVKMNLVSGHSNAVMSMLFPERNHGTDFEPGVFIPNTVRIRVSGDMVAAWSPGYILVLNWRQGAGMTLTERDDVHSLDFVQGHLVTVIRNVETPQASVVVAPILEIFRTTPGSVSQDSVALKSVCTHRLVLETPLTSWPVIQHVSICTPFWRSETGNVTESRIVVLIKLYDADRSRRLLAYRLLFSKLPRDSRRSADLYALEITDCSGYLPWEAHLEGSYMTSASQSGRVLIAKIVDIGLLSQCYYALSLSSLFEKPIHVVAINDPSLRNLFYRMHMEGYSGAVCDDRYDSIVIHYFD